MTHAKRPSSGLAGADPEESDGLGMGGAAPVHLVVDGVAVTPFGRLDDKIAFIVPAGAHEVRLLSATWSPRRVDPANPDDRELGIRIDALTIGGLIGEPIPVALDDDRLVEGFHEVEGSGEALFRWTDGDARLPAALWARRDGALVLRLAGAFENFFATEDDLHPARPTQISYARPNTSLLAGPSPLALPESPFHLVVDGGIVTPLARAHNDVAFVVPAGTRDIRLVSPTWSPRTIDPTCPDDRKLGLMIERLTIDDLVGPAEPVALDDPRLVAGFHPIEPSIDGIFRWTDGDARLSGGLRAECEDAFVLRVFGHFENAATNPHNRELVLCFENLGADCEFGIVQRLLTAEPLGLLRWADVPFRSLMDALEARFEGVGAPQNTQVSRGAGGEFFARDTRWGLDMHTFVKRPEAEAAQVLAKMCRHMSFLKDKLVADLQSATKVFIYKHDDLAMWELRALHDSLSRIGPVRLVHIKRAKGNMLALPEADRFVAVGPRLYIAYLDSLARDGLDVRIDDWVRVCRRVEEACGRNLRPANEKPRKKVPAPTSGKPAARPRKPAPARRGEDPAIST